MAKSSKTTKLTGDGDLPAPRSSGIAPSGTFVDPLDAPAASDALRPASTGLSVHQPVSRPGPPSTKRPVHPLDAALVKLLEKAFKRHAGADQMLDAGELRDALRLSDVFLAKRLLRVLTDSATSQGDRRTAPMVTRAEFVARVALLVSGDVEHKLRFAFCIHDLNGDGYIQREELLRMMTACMAEEVSVDEGRPGKEDPAVAERRRREQLEDAEKLTQVLLDAVDHNDDARLSYEEFAGEVCKHSGLFELITRSEAHWIVPQSDLLSPFRERRTLRQRLSHLLQNRGARLACLSIWLGINIALFVMGASAYEGWLQLARGSAACLYFNGALILVPTMRYSLTRIRQVRALRALPVDDALAFHRLVGHTMFVLALVHTGAHLGNYASKDPTISQQVMADVYAQTGLGLLVVFACMWGFTFLRRTKNFQLFYFTHWLYLGWFTLLLLHGKDFYLWAALPITGFVVDSVLRRTSSTRATQVVALDPLASEVTRVELLKPEGFEHNAGDYAFLRIPALAKHEWHPFTISSAPERDRITMHVRSLGNYTKLLRALAEQRQKSGVKEPLQAYLDGPFGTPSRHIFEARNVVLIGAGIGVTPFASVLESLVLRAHQGQGPLQRVHFFWLDREAYSFEWFHDLLTEIEESDQGRVVDIRIFMTSGRGHITATFLNLAREVLHQQGNPDLLTGLKSKTNMGRPDWERELREIAEQHRPEQVEVFYCGPVGLGRQIRPICRALGLEFRQEDF